MIYIFLFIAILGILVFKLFDLINNQIVVPHPASKTKIVRPTKTDLTQIFKDIEIEPYGCFSSLDEKFFAKQINPYSDQPILDSGIIISETRRDKDMKELIQQVINNGFEQYAYYVMNKYEKDPEGYSKNMSIKEMAVLGKLAGYNYLSIYKLNKNTRGNIYLTYSPPMDLQLPFNTPQDQLNKYYTSSDLPKYTLTPKLNNYTNEGENAPGKELACGYPCLPHDKPMEFDDKGTTKQYMCGSVAFPDINTPTRFAVYKIIEKS